MSDYFKHELNPKRYDFSKARTRLVHCLYSISPPVCYQGAVDSVYLILIGASDLASHNVVLTKLLLSDGYLN